MLKKMGIGIVVLAMVLCMTTGMGMATQSSLSDSSKEMLLNELKELLVPFEEMEVAAEGIGERLEIARTKEDTLYKLGKWQGELIDKLIDIIAQRIEEQAEINQGLETSIEGLQAKVEELENEVSLAKKVAAAAQIKAERSLKETTDLARRTEEDIALLTARVNDLVIRVKNLEEKVGVGPVIKLKSLKSEETSGK